MKTLLFLTLAFELAAQTQTTAVKKSTEPTEMPQPKHMYELQPHKRVKHHKATKTDDKKTTSTDTSQH